MKLAITGHRDISPDCYDLIYLALWEILTSEEVDELITGGARGVDTISLMFAWNIRKELSIPLKLAVIIPFTIYDQPKNIVNILNSLCDEIIELKLPKSRWAFLRRDDKLVEIADEVIAFYGERAGGTEYTIEHALKKGKLKNVIYLAEQLKEVKVLEGYYYFPQYDVYVLEPFERGTTLQGKINVLKTYKRVNVDDIAERIIALLKNEGVKKGVLMAIPRRTIGKLASVLPVLEKIEEKSNGRYINLGDVLKRVKELKGNHLIKGRLRFSPEMHEVSMELDLTSEEIELYKDYPVILIDDVITTGGSMLGAINLVKKFFLKDVFGIALTGGGIFGKSIKEKL